MSALAQIASIRAFRFPAVLTAVLVGTTSACGNSAGESADFDALPSLEASETQRIGSVDDPNVGFSRIGGVALDRDGRIYVYELSDSKLRVYDESGQLLRTIGGPGQGPGEFRSLSRLGVLGDTIWTIDMSQRRITLFDRTGAVLSTGNLSGLLVELQAQQMAGMVMPRAMRPDGLFTADMSMFVSRRGAADNRIGSNDTVMVPRVLFNAAGSVVDTIGWEPYPPPDQGDPQWVEVGSTRYNVPRRPSDRPLVVNMADGRFIIGRQIAQSREPAVFTVTRLSEPGDTLFTRQFQYTPVRYPDDVLDSLAWRSARIPGGAYNPATGPAPTPEGVDINVVRSMIRSAMAFPAFQLPVEYGMAGDDGTLWLRREDDGGSMTRWLILDGEGSARGMLHLPRRTQVRWVSHDEFVAVELDELDIPWLLRFRLGG